MTHVGRHICIIQDRLFDFILESRGCLRCLEPCLYVNMSVGARFQGVGIVHLMMGQCRAEGEGEESGEESQNDSCLVLIRSRIDDGQIGDDVAVGENVLNVTFLLE